MDVTLDRFLWADRLHFENIITNLFDNAIKYGAGHLRITTRVMHGDELMEIQVADDGIGIPGLYQELVFDPFFRIPQDNPNYQPRGFGLGLAYVKQMVLQHKGTIKINSEIGQGSTFTIKVPKNITYD